MKGIIFSAPMVIALLDGKKTVTRRPIKKPMPPYGIEPCWYSHAGWAEGCKDGCCSCVPFPCPYRPGETVYVKETWAQIWNQDGCLHADEAFKCPCDGCHVEYKADTGARYPADWPDDSTGDPSCPKWKSPLFMPEWAARIKLEIISVEPERLKDITVDECMKEGLVLPLRGGGFVTLWESIYGPGSWDANPWVWRIEFRKSK